MIFRRYRCTPLEARTLWYWANGFQSGQPTDAEIKAIRRDPPARELEQARAVLPYR